LFLHRFELLGERRIKDNISDNSQIGVRSTRHQLKFMAEIKLVSETAKFFFRSWIQFNAKTRIEI